MTISYSGSFLKLIFRWKGSIWKAVIWELVFFLFFYYHIRLISPIFFEWIDPDDSEGYKAIYKTMCVEFYEYSKLIPITFILGFYVSNIVTRWWSQFQSLKWPEDFLSTLCMLLPKHESKQTRHQIARYMNLTAALAWRDISVQIRSRFPTVRKIIDSGLMTETEFEMLEAVNDPSPGIRWLTPLHWIQQLIMKEVDAGRANAAFTVVTMNELKAYRESFRKLYCHDWVNVPLLYTQVAAIATYSYFFFCLFGRQDVKSVEPQHSLDHYFPLFTVVQFIFFVGWFKVGQDLIAPFGNDDDDFELSYILDRNIITSFTVVDSLQDGDPPGFEEDVFWNYYTTEHQIQNKIPTAMKWGRIDMSQNAHRRPPKLHARLRDEEDPNQGKYIAW